MRLATAPGSGRPKGFLLPSRGLFRLRGQSLNSHGGYSDSLSKEAPEVRRGG